LKSLGFSLNAVAIHQLNNRLLEENLLKIDYFSAMTRANERAAGGEIDPAGAWKGRRG
jgi:hypothetical protein